MTDMKQNSLRPGSKITVRAHGRVQWGVVKRTTPREVVVQVEAGEASMMLADYWRLAAGLCTH